MNDPSHHQYSPAPEQWVVIPTLNEEDTIGTLVAALTARGWPVLVVDDSSCDHTVDNARAAGAEVIIHPPPRGKGRCLRYGLDYVRKKWNPKGVFLMDGDGQHRPEDLNRFMEHLTAHPVDVLVGNRMHDPQDMPWLRRLVNRVMSWVLSLMCGCPIPDTQCGFRYLSRRFLDTVTLKAEAFEIESEILIEAARHGLRIESVPIQSVYEGERSHISPFRDTWRFLRFIWNKAFTRRKSGSS